MMGDSLKPLVPVSEPDFWNIDDLAVRGYGRHSKIYKMVANGEFPPPIKIGGASLWLPSEIRAFVAQRVAARDASKSVQ